MSNNLISPSDRISGSVNEEEDAIVLCVDFGKDFDIVSCDILTSNMKFTWNYHRNDLKTSTEQSCQWFFLLNKGKKSPLA